MKKHLGKVFAFLGGAADLATVLTPYQAPAQQIPVPQIVSLPFTWTTANVGQIFSMPLNGQTYCSVTTNVGSTYSGATITVLGNSDPLRNTGPVNAFTAVPGIGNTAGSVGQIVSPVAGTPYGGQVVPYALTYVAVQLTAL